MYVASIITILVAILVPQLMRSTSAIIEAVAKRRLRTIGSVMADYSLSRHGTEYTDFQDLKDANLISGEMTVTNFIKDYSLVFMHSPATTGVSNLLGYTVIAYPRPERSYGNLSTFALTEDNVIRVYKPGPDVNPTDPHTWDPIL